MRRRFILILLLLFPLVTGWGASIHEIEKGIYRSIIHSLFLHRNVVKIWSDDRQKEYLLTHIGGVVRTSDPADADILFIFHRIDVKAGKPVFVGRYSLFSVYGNRVIGGFYWQKGRPNLIFLRPGLERWGMKITDDLAPYVRQRP
ncbi:hypothetical protein [Hydrogenimonas sp. SS33]|uniref:hypothetical protein n=1 Tax=Hydrogenimonas leucolamina TaxID=2954236 RepID=UPI00336C1155